MVPFCTATLLGTYALQAWAQTSVPPTGTASISPNGHLLPERPVVLPAGDCIPIFRHPPGRLLRRDIELDLSGFPANFEDLPIKTEVNLEGEDIAIWALKFSHVDAVVPVLTNFLCGNPEYAPLFPILCRLQQASETESRSLIRPTFTSTRSNEYISLRSSQAVDGAHRTDVPDGDNPISVPHGTKTMKHKASTSTASPSKRLSTVFIPKGNSYITSIVELDDENDPIVPARTRSGGKSHSKTNVRGGGFSHLTRSRTPKTTAHRAKTKNSGPKSLIDATSSGKSTQSVGFHLTRSRQPRPSGRTKSSTPSPAKSSGSSFPNKGSGRITASRPSFPRPAHSTAPSKINSKGSDRSTTSNKQLKITGTGKGTPSPFPSSTNPPYGDDLSTIDKQFLSRSWPSHPTRSAPAAGDRSKASGHTRSIHQTISVSNNVTSTTSTPTNSNTSNTMMPGTETSRSKITRSDAWPPKKGTTRSRKSSTKPSTSTTDSSRSEIGTVPTTSQSGSFLQVPKTTLSSSSTTTTTGASNTFNGSSRRS